MTTETTAPPGIHLTRFHTSCLSLSRAAGNAGKSKLDLNMVKYKTIAVSMYTCNVVLFICDLAFSMSNMIIIVRIRTWMFSMSSELSQRIDESFTLLISAN